MTTYQGEPLEHTQAHAQAAYWFTRLNSGEATAAELREFEDWRRDDPENERSYRYICYFCDASLDAPEHEIRRLLASSGQKCMESHAQSLEDSGSLLHCRPVRARSHHDRNFCTHLCLLSQHCSAVGL